MPSRSLDEGSQVPSARPDGRDISRLPSNNEETIRAPAEHEEERVRRSVGGQAEQREAASAEEGGAGGGEQGVDGRVRKPLWRRRRERYGTR